MSTSTSSAITIRPLAPGDAATVAGVLRRISAIRHRHDVQAAVGVTDLVMPPIEEIAKDLAQSDGKDAQAFMAYAGHTSIACARARRWERPGLATINVWVADGWQSQGVGKTLWTVAVDWCRTNGVRYIVGGVPLDNEAGVKLLKSQSALLEQHPDDPWAWLFIADVDGKGSALHGSGQTPSTLIRLMVGAHD